MNKPKNSADLLDMNNLFSIVRLGDNSDGNMDTALKGKFINFQVLSRGPIRPDLIEAIRLAYRANCPIPIELGLSLQKLLSPPLPAGIDTQTILNVLADLILAIHSCDGTAQICTEEAERVLAAAKQTPASESMG
jgi:hypothetical protein